MHYCLNGVVFHFHDMTKSKVTSYNCVLNMQYKSLKITRLTDIMSKICAEFYRFSSDSKKCQPFKSWDKFNGPPDIYYPYF